MTVTPPLYNFTGGTQLRVSPSVLQIPAGQAVNLTFTLQSGASGLGVVDIEFMINEPGACSLSGSVFVTYQID